MIKLGKRNHVAETNNKRVIEQVIAAESDGCFNFFSSRSFNELNEYANNRPKIIEKKIGFIIRKTNTKISKMKDVATICLMAFSFSMN